MKKSIVRAVSALMGLGLVVAATSCSNAAAPAKVENVKASELTCPEGTSVTKDNAENVLKSIMNDTGLSGVFSVKSTSEDVSNVELAKIAFNMTRAASEEDPYANIEAAFEKFAKDLESGKASLAINESVAIKDQNVGLGSANGTAAVKVNLNVKNNTSTTANENSTLEDILSKTKIDYSAKGDANVNVKGSIAGAEGSPITSAKVNTIAKASVSGSVNGKVSELNNIAIKGSAAASDSTSLGLAFKTEDGVVGKVVASATVSAKITGEDVKDLITLYATNKVSVEEIEKALNDAIKVTFSVNVYDSANGSVFNKSFDSAKALDDWLSAK